jgi:8-oxo-dGTP diphosphatase
MGGPGERGSSEASADIVIVTALGLERDAVLAGLTDTRDVREAGTWFVAGTLPGSRARVATGVSGAGNSAAAAFTTQAIELFRPAAVLVVGVAGALHTDLRLGDVVVASRVYAYHGGRDEDDGFKPAATSWAASHELLQLAGRIAGDEGWRVLVRPIAAGEVVQDSRTSAAAAHLRRHFSSSAAIEMESAGVAEAAHRKGVPLLVIRGISDAADGTKTTADATGSQPAAAAHAASVAHEVIRAFRPPGTSEQSAETPAAADATYSYGSVTATNVFQGPTTIETFNS